MSENPSSLPPPYDGSHPAAPKPKSKLRRSCTFSLLPVLLLIVVILGGGALIMLLGKPLAKQAREIVQGPLVSMNGLKIEELKSISTSGMIDNLETTTSQKGLAMLNSKLGPLKSIDPSKEQWQYNWTFNGKYLRYSVPAEFEKGKGTLRLNFENQHGHLLLSDLNVSSEALMN